MRPLKVIVSLFGMVWLATGTQAATKGERAWVTSFQAGKVVAFDAVSGKHLYEIAVEDGSGATGLFATPDGRTLLVIDGLGKSRVRFFDAATGKLEKEVPYEDRVLWLGSGPTGHLTADGKTLYLFTFDYGAAAYGVRVLDLASGNLLPVGLRDRGCPSPTFLGAENGTLLSICPERFYVLQALPITPADRVVSSRVDHPLSVISAAVLSPDGKDLYAVGLDDQDSWKLVHWTVGEKACDVHDLQKLLGRKELPESQQAFLALSDRTLVLCQGGHAWFLATKELTVQKTVEGVGEGEAIAGPSGADVLTLDGTTLVRLSVTDGKVTRQKLAGLEPATAPSTFLLAAVP